MNVYQLTLHALSYPKKVKQQENIEEKHFKVFSKLNKEMLAGKLHSVAVMSFSESCKLLLIIDCEGAFAQDKIIVLRSCNKADYKNPTLLTTLDLGRHRAKPRNIKVKKRAS